MKETKSYRITIRRPIGGRMRAVGETVELTEREYQAEAGWGGLELGTAEAAPDASALVETSDEPTPTGLAAPEPVEAIDSPSRKRR